MPGLSSLQVNIKDQPHNLAWINEAEQDLLKDLGGSGRPGPMGIPAYDFDDFDDPEGVYDDVSQYDSPFSGGKDQANEDAVGSNQPEDITEQMGFAPDEWADPEAPTLSFDSLGDVQITGPGSDDLRNELASIGLIENRPMSGPDDILDEDRPLYPIGADRTTPEGRKASDYRTTEYTPGSPLMEGIANILQGVLPGGPIASLAGVKLGDIFGEKTTSYASTRSGDRLGPSITPDEPRDDGNADEKIIEEEIVKEKSDKEKELGTMKQFFADKKAEGVPEVLDNIIDRLGIQNRTIEPFNEWLAGQSQAMQATDRTTQTNKYRESLRDQTSPAQSYLPRVQPAADRTIEQSFINNLYPSSKKTSATDALYAELGI